MTIYAEVNHISLDGSHKEKIGEAVFTYVAVNEDLKPVERPIPQYEIKDSDQKKYIDRIKSKFNII